MKFCTKCGNKLDEDSAFCSNCGNKLNVSSEKGQEKFNISKNYPNFINSIISNPLIILMIIAIIVVLGVSSFGGMSNNDIVDVTSITMSVGYSDTPFGGAIESANAMEQDKMERLKYLKDADPGQYELETSMNGLTDEEIENYEPSSSTHRDYQVGDALIKFSLMPRETITRMTSLSVSNIEVVFENGETENWGSYKFNPNDYYLQDNNYRFSITHTLGKTGENIDKYYSISHIKADIVMNTTDKTNVVIGHINEDITPEHD